MNFTNQVIGPAIGLAIGSEIGAARHPQVHAGRYTRASEENIYGKK